MPSLSCGVGERSLFCLTPNGVLRFTKKLDFNPSCLFAYHASASEGPESFGVIKTLLLSHSNQLLVLQDASLIWAAAIEHTPIQVTTANFQLAILNIIPITIHCCLYVENRMELL